MKVIHVNSFVYGKSYVTGINEKTACVFEGKFIVEDEGYEYMLYKGGVGSSFLMISINNSKDFKKIAEIPKNQIYYNYNSGCYKYSFKKGDIIYFKILLLTDEGSTNGIKQQLKNHLIYITLILIIIQNILLKERIIFFSKEI